MDKVTWTSPFIKVEPDESFGFECEESSNNLQEGYYSPLELNSMKKEKDPGELTGIIDENNMVFDSLSTEEPVYQEQMLDDFPPVNFETVQIKDEETDLNAVTVESFESVAVDFLKMEFNCKTEDSLHNEVDPLSLHCEPSAGGQSLTTMAVADEASSSSDTVVQMNWLEEARNNRLESLLPQTKDRLVFCEYLDVQLNRMDNSELTMDNAKKCAVILMVYFYIDSLYEASIKLRRDILQRNANERKRRIILCLWLRNRQQRYLRTMRRPTLYCQMEFINKAVLDILNGDMRSTTEHLRVTPQSLALFVSKLEKKTHGWELEFEAIVFLSWLATGTCFRVVCTKFQLARSTTWGICRRMLEQTVRLAATTIMLPVGNDLNVVGQGFAALAGSPAFSLATGAIGTCQIRTLCPSALPDRYINRKLFYSVGLQGLVDHRGIFINICAGFPGSADDMQALRQSHLWRNGTYPPLDYFILGNEGYQSHLDPICIVTPYRTPLTPEKTDFNNHLSKAHSVVEWAFGNMEVRWPSIFTKALEVKLSTGVKVLGACAILHNICMSAGNVMSVDVRNQLPGRRPVRDEADGLQFRDMLLNQFEANRHQGAEAINAEYDVDENDI